MYSQYDEETHILAAFELGDVAPEDWPTEKRFLDIGAWNAKDKSNTRALYERAWSGVMIEPSPGPMLNLLAEYGDDERITLIEGAVTVEPGLITLHITDDAVSTSNEAEFEKWKGTAKYIGKLTVPGIPLQYLAQRFGGFDFINIDAEGSSVELLFEMMNLGWQPRCICVEHDGRTSEIISRVTPLHYHVVYGNETNVVLVRG